MISVDEGSCWLVTMQIVHRRMWRLVSPLLVCPLCPMTELENALSSVNADAFAAVQRYTVIETELVFLVAIVCILARFKLCTQPCTPGTLTWGKFGATGSQHWDKTCWVGAEGDRPFLPGRHGIRGFCPWELTKFYMQNLIWSMPCMGNYFWLEMTCLV